MTPVASAPGRTHACSITAPARRDSERTEGRGSQVCERHLWRNQRNLDRGATAGVSRSTANRIGPAAGVGVALAAVA
eukprot:scaffold152_cov383-Prasinococcus_capsulatus_cf.AAC.9